MDAEQIYQQLTELAEKLGISVSEKNLRQINLRVQSGLCKVHGEAVFVMDKHISTAEKIRLLSECLSQQPLEEVYLLPALREVIEQNRPVGSASDRQHPNPGQADEKNPH
mgnify:FL=1